MKLYIIRHFRFCDVIHPSLPWWSVAGPRESEPGMVWFNSVWFGLAFKKIRLRQQRDRCCTHTQHRDTCTVLTRSGSGRKQRVRTGREGRERRKERYEIKKNTEMVKDMKETKELKEGARERHKRKRG